MKLSSFSTIILFHLATSSIYFISPIQCTLNRPSLVEQICRKTPHYNLCVSTLKSHLVSQHGPSRVNIEGFARTTLQAIAVNASAALKHVHKVFEQTNDKQMRIALDSCIASYNNIVKVLLPEAISCINNGDNKGVKSGASAIANLVISCENKCMAKTNSPMTYSNQYVQNLCAIAASIVNYLPQAHHQGLHRFL
ncbi:hypothetical protein Lal_00044077 [Lupinus albus]|uniref:Putative pectinesterase inhibitor domain, Cell wall/vacuolar inhibitor of fructosidase n=1 Tax=Lupinus albus TaxID=3870 RepID=A0A6A5PCK3_LUPAL|nr:putative pectinesterase inhibitor domain, Cell wall/vacuolar inhibitor of fructosidase [Lupinus albus]KAF1895427.1 hypothetical protein Lal_00044077 [Lupinus albus]